MQPTRARRRMPPRQQRGYMLITVAFAMVFVGAIMTMLYQQQARSDALMRDASNGAQAAQFAIGLRGFLAAAQETPAILPGAAKTGVNWLKAPGCGGLATNPANGYLPCGFTGGPLGASFSTTFTRDAVTNFIEVRTTFVVPPVNGNPKSPILAADRLVQAALGAGALPASTGTFFNAFANVAAAANAPASPLVAPGVNAGRVVMIASNAPSNDVWLRTDGTNRMLANLNMGGMSIGNARDGQFTGNVRINQQLQVDQGATVMGVTDARGGVITNEVALTGIGHYATEGIYDAKVYTGATSYSIPKPNCTLAGNTPGIYVGIQSTGTPNNAGYTGDAIYGARADVTDAGASWTITPVVQATKFDLVLSGTNLAFNKTITVSAPTDMRVLVMTRCR